jgi:hypothetical protein
MRGERGVWMGRDLRGEDGLVGRPNQPDPSGTWARPMASGVGSLATPAANRGWIDPVQIGDINHSMTVIHCGQGSFTDVV